MGTAGAVIASSRQAGEAIAAEAVLLLLAVIMVEVRHIAQAGRGPQGAVEPSMPPQRLPVPEARVPVHPILPERMQALRMPAHLTHPLRAAARRTVAVAAGIGNNLLPDKAVSTTKAAEPNGPAAFVERICCPSASGRYLSLPVRRSTRALQDAQSQYRGRRESTGLSHDSVDWIQIVAPDECLILAAAPDFSIALEALLAFHFIGCAPIQFIALGHTK
jgi:hypothetical protein